MTHPTPDAFDQRWMAEALRLRETNAGALDDSAALRCARAVGGAFEDRLIARAMALAKAPDGVLAAWQGWTSQASLAWIVMAILAALGGIGIAGGVLGDGTRPVNIVWALGGLLGLHLLTLLLWLLAAATPRRRGSSLAGQLWITVTGWLSRRHDAAWLPQALFDILQQRRAGLAWAGRISHGLWLITLTSALIALLTLLSTRRYGFVWETTILPANAFVGLTEVLAWLPRQAGLAMPDADTVLRAAGPLAVEADRQHWSAWLVSALILYGILPRLLFWLGCHVRWRRHRRGFRLDLTQPGYARLKPRLMPASEPTGISDAAPNHLPAYHTGHATMDGNGARIAVALELGDDIAWPPPALPPAYDGGRLDERNARRHTLDALAAQPVERLLVAIDPRLSPDRGTLALIAELSRYAHACAIWLAGNATDSARRSHWHEALTQLGVAPSHRFDTDTAACDWLERGDD